MAKDCKIFEEALAMIIGSPEWCKAVEENKTNPRPQIEVHSGLPVPDLWANFLANEKMTPKAVGPENIMILVDFCNRLAVIRGPRVTPYKLKQESRRFLCQKAMEWGIDLPAMCKIGRGLLDAWLLVYKELFGGVYGTAAFKEAVRRNVVTRLSKERDATKPVPPHVQREMDRFLNPATRHDLTEGTTDGGT
jgi:hypothetical protein